MKRLSGKTVLITGGSSGIGLASAKRLVAEGAFVYISGRRQTALDAALEEIGSSNLRAVACDVSRPEDLDRLFEVIRAERGQLDVLFANAGGGSFAPLGAITPEHVRETFGTNVEGTIFTVQKALPLLKTGSSVILTSSTTGTKGTPAFSVYSASKAAIRNLARSWALDLRGTGVRVNVLSPGATETPGLLGLADTTEAKAAMSAQFASMVPLGRLADPSETAAVVAFLASDDSRYMNGSEVFVDGGLAQI